MTPWISVDDRVKRGLKIIEQVENSKLRLLVNRICQSLKSGISEDIFKAEEEEKLLVSLSLEKADLAVLLQTITTIYTQASFHLIKPNVIETSMKDNFSIADDKIAILSHAWVAHSEEIIAAFKQNSIFPSQVADVSWHVDVKAASTARAKHAKPVAKLQLKLEGSESSRVTIEMDKTQLRDLYQQLNDIQSQLDSLNKEK